jgi:hypothetical protein
MFAESRQLQEFKQMINIGENMPSKNESKYIKGPDTPTYQFLPIITKQM